LGLIGQNYSGSNVWILGQSFMENFYVTYDATDVNTLRVGLSYNVDIDGTSI